MNRLAPGVITQRPTEVGRIRLGDKQPTQKGGSRPNKLSKFRLTSNHLDLLQAAAVHYGGTPRPWKDAPSGPGTQHELYVEADVLEVMVPPGSPLSQSLEMWSGGGCTRRCDGVTVTMTTNGRTEQKDCVCPVDVDERNALAQKGQACKLTTRLSLWLPRIPGIGVWRLESHGYYAAAELPGAADLLSLASEMNRPIMATLRIAQRTVIRNGKTSQFIVPQLDPQVSVGSMYAVARGEVPQELMNERWDAIGPGEARQPAPPATAALPPAREHVDVVEVVETADLTTSGPPVSEAVLRTLRELKALTPEQQEKVKAVAAGRSLSAVNLAADDELHNAIVQTMVEIS